MKKFNAIKMIGFVGTVLGFLAPMITNWSEQKEMEKLVEEKVNKAIAEKQSKES